MKDIAEILVGMGITEEVDETTELQVLGVNSLQLMERVVRIEEK